MRANDYLTRRKTVSFPCGSEVKGSLITQFTKQSPGSRARPVTRETARPEEGDSAPPAGPVNQSHPRVSPLHLFSVVKRGVLALVALVNSSLTSGQAACR
ncbi:hypothetical protein SKAU_G00001950 [Synaphobranchus kaupii]|uniref:Uncharacterized protein n=1 Tax=Synaphobranchus kaupii TaxID=118154 RepID=A0A9Q1G8K2_SYNKA|nr:hypothetical protein SKAU_G00001950 [Synaphobranchus kaupii]